MNAEHSQGGHRKHVHIHIDEKLLESPSQTTGEALYVLGNIKPGYDLFRERCGKLEEEPIDNGHDQVNLADDDRFRSEKRKGISIIVNTRPRTVQERKQSFEQIVALAYNPVPTGSNILITVTYGNGPKQNPEGKLSPGDTVKIKDGMVFCVKATDKS